MAAFLLRKDTTDSNEPTGLADGLEDWSPLSRDANTPRGADIAPVGPPGHGLPCLRRQFPTLDPSKSAVNSPLIAPRP